MKRLIAISLGALLTIGVQAQKKAIFEIGASYHTFDMGAVNKSFINDFAKPIGILDDNINSGPQGFAKLKYAPGSFFEVGIMLNYQVGTSSGQSTMYLTDINGEVTDYLTLYNDFYAESIGVGYTSCWYLSDLLGFNSSEKPWVRRTHLGVEVNLGVAYSNAIYESLDNDNINAVRYEAEANGDFQGQIGISGHHNFIQKRFFSGIGFRVGYQHLKTRDLRFNDDTYWEVKNERMNLDFSGFYAGVYMRFGKAFLPY
jgi:hypothetical protein